jgi:DNA-binding MarR family transcriptional regulator
MESHGAEQLADEFIGSAHILVAAVIGMKNTVLGHTAGKGLSFSQLKILKLIDVAGSHYIGDVAAFLDVSDAAASKAVDRLVRQKYLRRSEGRSDRRSSEIVLAAAGRKVLQQYDAAKDGILQSIFRDLDPHEVRRAVALMEGITRRVVCGSASSEEICLQCAIYLKKRCLVRDGARAECKYHRRRKTRQTQPVEAEP